ncbi:sporulation-induced protein [Tritrichomonas musculus]|uniref:Sporulation-induced protein n=1 Tax=Tritrichomonas musculus TaxID=1915356 RepID=A0ABR2JLK8_9EUKA
MSWNFGGPNLDSIKNLVTADGTTLEQVLNDNLLTPSLRFETEEVIEFFSKRDIIKSLLIWSITTQNDEDPNYFKYSRIATNVLTTPCIQLQNVLIDSNLLLPAFRNFFRLDPEESPLICGNYQRVVEYFIRVTRGEILEQFPEITSFLIDRIQVLPLRLLLFNILIELKEYLSETQSVLDNLSEIIEKGGPTAFGAVDLLFDLIKNENNPFKGDSMEGVVNSLFNFAILDTSTSLYKVQAYVVLELIIKLYGITNFTETLNDYEGKVDFTSEGIDGIHIFRVYPNSHLSEAFTRFFKDTTNCTLGSICLSSIKSQENLIEFVKDNHILEQILELYPDEKCSGYLTEIALFLSEKVPGKEESNCDEKDTMYRWGKFVKNQIVWKKQQISQSEKYGGERPAVFGRTDTSLTGKNDISPITGIVTKTKISNDNAFNFDSDSDEDSSSDDEEASTKTSQTNHLIRKDPVQNLHLSSSDEEKNSDGENEGKDQNDGNKDGDTEEKTQEQEYSDMMMKLWGFSIAPVKKKEEVDDEESSYSYNDEDEEEQKNENEN